MDNHEISQMLRENGYLKAKVQQHVKESLEMASKFAYNANKSDFQFLFGNDIGEHIWNRFLNFDRNLLLLWGVLSPKYKDHLSEYIEKWYGGNYGA